MSVSLDQVISEKLPTPLLFEAVGGLFVQLGYLDSDTVNVFLMGSLLIVLCLSTADAII